MAVVVVVVVVVLDVVTELQCLFVVDSARVRTDVSIVYALLLLP